jgi:hypothetical protein
MPRKPVGTQTRPTADWFAGVSGTAGAYAQGPAASGVEISLFNSADAGQYVYVNWITVYNDAEAPYRGTTRQGAQGSGLSGVSPVVAGNPLPNVQLLWQPVPQTTDQPIDTAFGDELYFGDEAGTTTCFRSPGPVKVLPPQWSLAIVNEMGGGPANGAILCVTFHFTILPYIPT